MYMYPRGVSPAGPCSKVVERWIGGATAPVAGSGFPPAWTVRVWNRMVFLAAVAGRRTCVLYEIRRPGGDGFEIISTL
jgi:hypothetical protein